MEQAKGGYEELPGARRLRPLRRFEGARGSWAFVRVPVAVHRPDFGIRPRYRGERSGQSQRGAPDLPEYLRKGGAARQVLHLVSDPPPDNRRLEERTESRHALSKQHYPQPAARHLQPNRASRAGLYGAAQPTAESDQHRDRRIRLRHDHGHPAGSTPRRTARHLGPGGNPSGSASEDDEGRDACRRRPLGRAAESHRVCKLHGRIGSRRYGAGQCGEHLRDPAARGIDPERDWGALLNAPRTRRQCVGFPDHTRQRDRRPRYDDLRRERQH